MKPFFKILRFALIAGAVVGAVAYLLHPHPDGSSIGAVAAAPARTLDFYPAPIRAFLQSGTDEAATLRDAAFNADAAIAAAASRLNALPANAAETDAAKRAYLEAGFAKLDHVRRVADAYDRHVTRALATGAVAPAATAAPSVPSKETPAGTTAASFALIAAFSAAALVLFGGLLISAVLPKPVAIGAVAGAVPAAAPPPVRLAPTPTGRPDPATLRAFRLILGTGAVALDMLPVRAGSFDAVEGGKTHTVPIAYAFWLGKYEVTQAQWKAVMGENPSKHPGDLLPVESVSHAAAAAFCEKLTQAENAAGRLPAGYAYALPTEAEWEYAARAGGGAVNSGWTALNSGGQTHLVGEQPPNAWGFHDMVGNVAEMCADTAVGNLTGGNGTGLRSLREKQRITRGSSIARRESTQAVRDAIVENTASGEVGFRLALRRIS